MPLLLQHLPPTDMPLLLQLSRSNNSANLLELQTVLLQPVHSEPRLSSQLPASMLLLHTVPPLANNLRHQRGHLPQDLLL